MTGYLHHPTIQGDTLVFACEDDLWSAPATGGPATRLTAGVAEAARPRLSPDGRMIAFTGAEDGPTELYVMPSAGGQARRLTFQAARCAPVGWHPRTGEIVYASTAERPTGFGYRLFAVAPEGGAPRLLGQGSADTLAFGPEGGVVIGRNTGDPARWKRYRGGCAGELWVGAREDGPLTPLSDLPGNVASPCWVGERIFFLSDHEGVANVFSCRPDGTGLTRHTDHRAHYARHLAGDGRRLVYQAGARLHLLDPAEGGHSPIDVSLPATRAGLARRFVPAGEYLEAARLSPDGATLAVAARGQAFTLPPWSGPVRRHGRLEGVRYRLLDWLWDGTRLVAVAGDERPGERLVSLSADGGDEETELVGRDLGCVTELAASPASGLVAFATSRQRLWVVDADAASPEPRLLDTGAFDRIADLAWSPDGRWLAYTYPRGPHHSAIKVADAVTGRAFSVTEPVLRDSRPAFDPGGRFLYFIGQRDPSPEYDQVRFDMGFPFGTRPYLVALRAGDPSPFRTGPPLPGPAPEEDGVPPVEIDVDGIADRVVPLPVPEGRYAGVVGLPGRALLLSVPVAAPDPESPEGAPEGVVTLVEWATSEVTEHWLGPLDEIVASRAGDLLLYRRADRLRVLAADDAGHTAAEYPTTDAPPGPTTGWIDLDRITVPLHPAGEWRQMFREAWRLQRESFWDAGMAGVDWDAMYARYAPLAELVSRRSELSDLIWELQGELATSHAYEQGGDHPRGPSHTQGFLGVDWTVERAVDRAVDRDAAPGGDRTPRWRVGRILRGDPWNPRATSPCNRLGADIEPGDAVVAVGGQPVGPSGPGEFLVGQADREVELTVVRGDGTPRRVTVRACASEARARLLDWVAGNRALVRRASGGRLGYLHVPDMLGTGYGDFVRGFLAALEHDGLIVDARFNSGGHVSPLLLDRLARRGGGTQRGRWNGVSRYPAEAPRGSMAVLVNEHTGSDGEIFAHRFRALGLGPVVGRRTWGGVIATWPRHVLADGTVTTQPEFRFYLDGVGDLLENRGVEPDLCVDQPPRLGTTAAPDAQLTATVELLLARLDGADRAGADRAAAGDRRAEDQRAAPAPALATPPPQGPPR
ncbi:S41 family peptidase [Streptomyces radicis]|uniref:S41 family peptidase n=1 Tax=Streptomyces radicis TaxID=1750517 RepID=UPI0016015CD5|nr:S41 family peptidase [Streptomyces radicis]